MKRIHVVLSMMLVAVGSVHADIVLDTSALPSTQGWAFSSAGMHSGLTEADVFSVSGSVLTLDNMAAPVNFSGGSLGCRIQDVALDSMYSILEWTSRTTAYEKDGTGAHNNAFYVALGDGQYSYLVGISMDNIHLYNGSGTVIMPFDGTEYHTYRIETTAGEQGYDFYVDDSLQTSLLGRSNASSTYQNFLVIGDSTSTANAIADISSLEFSQVPEPSTVVLLGASGLGLVVFRRKFHR